MALDLDALSAAVVQHLHGLPGYRHQPRKGEHWACCPMHKEQTASFHYNEQMMAWKCHGGCDSGGNLVSLAKKIGIELKKFGVEDPPVTYDYKNPDGVTVIRKKRYYDDYEKKFTFSHAKGEKFVSGEGDESYLYNLPQVLNAIALGYPIYIANGEKAADALTAAEVTATCSPHGESIGQWKDKGYFKSLKGADTVIIVEQLDEKGKEYADDLARVLRKFVRLVRIVQPKTGKYKHDAYDHLRAGHKVDDFKERVKYQRGFDLIFANGTFVASTIDYLIEPYLPKGRVILLDADGGAGKSSWCASLTAALSRGYDPINMKQIGEPVRTMYLIGDTDPWEEYETIYRANGGREKFCGWLPRIQPDGSMMQFTDDTLRSLEETITDSGIGLVVIDPLTYYIDGLKIDTNVALQVLGICSKLGAIAMRTGCTIIAIRHTTKGQVGRKASELGMGSVQFRNSFRGQLVMRYHPEKRGVVVVTDEKGSMLVPHGRPFAFVRQGNEIHYEQIMDSPFEGEVQKQYGRPNAQRQTAGEALREYLKGADIDSRVAIAHVQKVTGASESTIRRAADNLGITSNNGFWSLDPFADFGGEVESP